jgi:L-lactate dehydrogenase complex protein LldG
MSAREDILAATRRRAAGTAPPRYAVPDLADPPARFAAQVNASHAQLHQVLGRDDVPAAVLSIVVGNDHNGRVFLPKESELHALPWHRTPALTLSGDTPRASDIALSEADWGIAETGTLVFFAGRARPSSWHFLPGREIVLIRRERVVPAFEDMIAKLPQPLRLPSTMNLVTGPSRTGDIEQTMERGAHGPRDVDILLIG